MKVIFDEQASRDEEIYRQVEAFLAQIETLEILKDAPIIIYQDGKSETYYIKCNIQSKIACPLLDMNAKLNPDEKDSFRANRELKTGHNTYKRMLFDAKKGREFNDIIVEYTLDYSSEKPLKIWGGQHRSKAIQEAYDETGISRYHGFRIFFGLSKHQRTEVALVSNTNINISNELFDRLQEETFVGLTLRNWCYRTSLLEAGEDFPDKKSNSEKITVKLARTFVTNFYMGKDEGDKLKNTNKDLDEHIYEPYLCKSGSSVETDPEYDSLLKKYGDSIWEDPALIQAGEAFSRLHKAQHKAVVDASKRKLIDNRQTYRNKAFVESVISAWAYVAGLLQESEIRLKNHYQVPKTNKSIPDPLNSAEMARFKHDTDSPTYRGLGTRSAAKDRQRMAQLFLARSLQKNVPIDRKLMDQAVSQVVGLKTMQRGYKP